MFGQAITILLSAAQSVYNWFTSILSGIGSDAWATIYAMIIVMSVTRFIIYPFLKGRVVGGVGEEFNHRRDSMSNHYIYDNSDNFNPRGRD